MIPFDIVYIRPDSLKQAVDAFRDFDHGQDDILYYAGGTEILTRIRAGKVHPRVLIDIKQIPECIEIGDGQNEIILGTALTLNTVIDSNLFPLLSNTADRVSDHTTRNQITLGGNCAGNLPYREALLPLLLAEASVEIAGPSGRRTLRLDQTYHKQLRLEPGELLVSFSVNRKLASAPFYHRRREVHSKIDYPLVTACFLVDPDSGSIRMAVSGAFFYPVRSVMVERVLNDRTMTIRLRAKRVIDAFQVTLREDFRGSSSYRRMLLERIIVDALSELEKEHVGV